jgi:PEP-CTERM motif
MSKLGEGTPHLTGRGDLMLNNKLGSVALIILAFTAVRPAHSAAIPISENANCNAANSCAVLEFLQGSIDVTLKNVSAANITVNTVTINNPPYLFIFGDGNDKVNGTAIPAAKNNCNGAVLAPNATCLFTQTYTTTDPVVDGIVDKGHWEIENLVTLGDGTSYVATIGVDVLDPQTTPEPGTLLLLGAGLLGFASVVRRRRGV